jgi:glycosyltransferase involved in cell wall biosynthesis
MGNKLPLVSVVVTTRNEENNLGNCLLSLQGQTYPQEKIETIVVDNHSTDQTVAIAHRYTRKVFQKGPERSTQRNFGLKKARGKYVMYLDADMILSANLVLKAIEKLEKEGLVALYLPEVVLGNSFWSRVRRFERSFYDGTAIDCVRILKKEIFERTGGFDTSLTGPEDWDLDKKIRRLGKVALLCSYDLKEIDRKVNALDYTSPQIYEGLITLPSVPLIYHNESAFNFKKYVQKKNFYALSFQRYINKWKDDSDIKKQFSFAYRYFGVFWENGKWKRLFEFPLLMMGMYWLRLAVGVTFLKSKFKTV